MCKHGFAAFVGLGLRGCDPLRPFSIGSLFYFGFSSPGSLAPDPVNSASLEGISAGFKKQLPEALARSVLLGCLNDCKDLLQVALLGYHVLLA